MSLQMFGIVCLVLAVTGFGLREVWGPRPSGREPTKSIVLDVVKVLAVVLAFLGFAALIAGGPARAGEGLGLHSGGARISLYHELDGYRHFCQELRSGIGALHGQPELFVDVYRLAPDPDIPLSREFTASLSYKHNSCAFGPDSRSSDAVGLTLEWRAW